MTNKPILTVLSGQPVWPPPVWMMRQAGRHLPEYKATRAEAGSFLALVTNPELAAEVTLQPVRRYGMDGAILFRRHPDGALGDGPEALDGGWRGAAADADHRCGRAGGRMLDVALPLSAAHQLISFMAIDEGCEEPQMRQGQMSQQLFWARKLLAAVAD